MARNETSRTQTDCAEGHMAKYKTLLITYDTPGAILDWPSSFYDVPTLEAWLRNARSGATGWKRLLDTGDLSIWQSTFETEQTYVVVKVE